VYVVDKTEVIMIISKKQKIIVILCVAFITLTPFGCRKETTKTESKGLTMTIELGVGVGPIKFGMQKDEVIKILGKPDKTDGSGQGLNYVESKGISLFVTPKQGVTAIDCWSEDYPLGNAKNFNGKTKKGIGMNAARAEIVAAYGQPDKTSSNGPLTTLYYQKLNAQFSLAGDKLVDLKMGVPRKMSEPSPNVVKNN
jgi:hypothetical protein